MRGHAALSYARQGVFHTQACLCISLSRSSGDFFPLHQQRNFPLGSGFSPHIRSISKPHWFYFPNVPRICPLFTTLSATTLTGPIISCLDQSNHLLPVLSDPLLPTSHPAPLSKSDLPRRLEGACEHPSRHVPLLGPFHGSHLTRDKSPRLSRGPHVPA